MSVSKEDPGLSRMSSVLGHVCIAALHSSLQLPLVLGVSGTLDPTCQLPAPGPLSVTLSEFPS